jgi:hypothetical protein
VSWLLKHWFDIGLGIVLAVIGVGTAAVVSVAVILIDRLKFSGALELHVEWTKQ